jgi:polysaccharide biosynthesis transport protein
LEAQLAESLERERKGERFSLIEPPQLPEKPDKPNRLALLIMSFVVSIGGGLTNVMIREGIDQTIHGSKGVAAITKTQPLGIIPVIKTGQDLRKSTLKRMYVVLGICFAFCLIVALVHVYYKPLDVIWYLGLQKVGLDIGN